MILQTRSLASTVLTLFIVGRVVTSIETSTLPPNHKEPIDMSSTNLKMEARAEEIELSQTSESSTQIPKVYPVYPEYRTNTEKPPKSHVNWKISKPSSKDSYLDALEYSHTAKKPRDSVIRFEKPKGVKLIRRNYDGPVYRPSSEYGGPSGVVKTPRIAYGGPTAETFSPTPSTAYSLPVQHAIEFGDQNAYGTGVYAAPQSHYGPPSSNYGPPAQSYGVPHTAYGAPQYGHPPATQLQQGWSGYALPELPQLPQLPSLPSIDLAWPLAIKLNAFTIAKIILKLVIFKMIVKFIAIICLLLFIPKLEIKSDKDNEEDDESRKLITSDSTMERLNILTAMVQEAIEKYENANGINHSDNCTSVTCRMRRFLTSGDSWDDYVRLFKSYAAEEKSTEAEEENSIET